MRRVATIVLLATLVLSTAHAEAPAPKSRIGQFIRKQFSVGTARPHVPGTKRVGLWEGSASQHILLGVQNTGHALAIGAAAVDLSHGPAWHVIPALAIARAGLFVADASVAALHWTLDNYFHETTPGIGTHVRTFREHHIPRLVRSQGNSSIPSLVSGFSPLTIAAMVPALALGHTNWELMSFMSTFALVPWGLVTHSEAHKTSKEQGPIERKVTNALRKVGLAVSVEDHLKGHHGRGAAHAEYYSTLTGESNRVIAKTKAFRHAERLIYERTGVMPNDWREEEGGAEVMNDALGKHPALKAKAEAELAREVEAK